MAGLDVKELPGVGRSLERRLAALGIQTCGDMQTVSLAVLQVLGNICFILGHVFQVENEVLYMPKEIFFHESFNSSYRSAAILL